MQALTKQLRDLLRAWQRGELTAREVHESAEAILRQVGRPIVPEEDSHSIPLEVVSQLDILNHQWIVRDDIPAILDFLNTEPGDEILAWSRWRSYWAGIDYEARKRMLREDPYYCT